MKWIMVMHHFSSNIGPKRLQSQQSPVMVVGVSLVILNTDNSILVETEFWNRLPVNEKYINIFFIVFLVLWDRYFLFVCMMMLCELNYQGRYQPSSIKGLNHTYDISFIELMRFLKKSCNTQENVIWQKPFQDKTIPRGARKAILFHCTLFIYILTHHDRWNRLLLWKN